MIYYRGSFADIEDTVYVVDIQVKNLTDSGVIHELIFDNDTPCKITTKSEGLFSPIKSRGCTISLLTTELLMNIWSSTSQGVEVNIYNTNGWPVNMSTADIPATYTNIFHGFLTPCAYTQGYSDSIETLELEAVEALSTLKDIDYTPYNGTDNQIVAFKYILKKLLYDVCGYDGKLYFPRSFSSVDGTSFNRYLGTVLIDSVAISESNFYDDDETHTPWKCYDVIEEMMKYLNCTLVPYGKDIWIVDYNYINAKGALWGAQGNDTQYYKCYNLDNIDTTSDFGTNTFDNVIQKNNYSDSGQSITLDDVYNKVSVSENTYPVEEIITDIFEDNNLINTNLELNMDGPSTSIWNRTITNGILWWKTSKTFPIATDYQMFSRLDEENTNWKHHWYNHTSLLERSGEKPYYNPSSSSEYTDDRTNRYYNTMGALIQDYAFIKNSDSTPASLDWKKYITFFAIDDTFNTTKNNFEQLCNKPVLEYTSPDSIVYSAKNGKSYITFNGKLWFQKSKDSVIKIVNTADGTKIYKTNPIEDVIDTGDPFELPNPRRIRTRYTNTVPGGSQHGGSSSSTFNDVVWTFRHHRVPEQMGYGTGFKILKLRLQIGDKYWNGTTWTTNPSDFFINYNNNPQPKENSDGTIGYDDEYLNALEWMTPVYNTIYTDGIGKDCVAIPLNYDLNNNPINIAGKLKFTIYMPWQWDNYTIDTPAQQTYVGDVDGFYEQPFYNYCPCIYMKDLELNYVYVDDSPWWLTSDDDKSDIEYINLISNDNVIDGDEIELKINSWYDDKPISRSYTIYSNKYISNIEHSTIGVYQPQEKNIINNYYNHYSSPKLMYNCSVKDYYYPYAKFAVRCLTNNVSNEDSSNDTYANDDYKFLLDTQEWDVKNRKNQIQLIQY